MILGRKLALFGRSLAVRANRTSLYDFGGDPFFQLRQCSDVVPAGSTSHMRVTVHLPIQGEMVLATGRAFKLDPHKPRYVSNSDLFRVKSRWLILRRN